jgi:hypothetical protein
MRRSAPSGRPKLKTRKTKTYLTNIALVEADVTKIASEELQKAGKRSN